MSEMWKKAADTVLADRERWLENGGASTYYFDGRQLEIVNERLDTEGLRNKVWMVMPYRCDSAGCGAVRWYECEVGVEGPPEWRADGTYIASPFGAGTCTRCGGQMLHMMHRDVVFPAPVESGTPFLAFEEAWISADRYFRVPREPVTYVTQGCDESGNVIYTKGVHAFLSTPMHAIERATAGRQG